MKRIFLILTMMLSMVACSQTQDWAGSKTFKPTLKFLNVPPNNANTKILSIDGTGKPGYIDKAIITTIPTLNQVVNADPVAQGSVFLSGGANLFADLIIRSTLATSGFRLSARGDGEFRIRQNGGQEMFRFNIGTLTMFNNTGISHFGANYFVPYLRSNGALYSDKNLHIIAAGNNSVEIRTGADLGTAVIRLKIEANGEITLIGNVNVNGDFKLKSPSNFSTKIATPATANNIQTLINADGVIPLITQKQPKSRFDPGVEGQIYFKNSEFYYYSGGQWWLSSRTNF